MRSRALPLAVALLAVSAGPSLACVGDLVLPKPATTAQSYAFAAGQILGRAGACGIRTGKYENRVMKRIPQLARGHADRSCAYYGFDHFIANLMYYQERHSFPDCRTVKELFAGTDWSVDGIHAAQQRFKEATAKAISKSATAKLRR